MRTLRVRRARIPYTWGEIAAVFVAALAVVGFLTATGCLRLFMGGGVPHNEYRAPRDASP